METGETCLYNKSIKNKHKEVYGMKKKMMIFEPRVISYV